MSPKAISQLKASNVNLLTSWLLDMSTAAKASGTDEAGNSAFIKAKVVRTILLVAKLAAHRTQLDAAKHLFHILKPDKRCIHFLFTTFMNENN